MWRGESIMARISRRKALRTFGEAWTLTGISLAASGSLQASVYGNSKVTAFALAGDRYHNIDYIRTALGKTLVKDLGISIDFTDERSLLTASNLKPYKLLIMLRDGMVWPSGYEGAPGRPIVSDPPLAAKFDTTPVYWMTPEQGK